MGEYDLELEVELDNDMDLEIHLSDESIKVFCSEEQFGLYQVLVGEKCKGSLRTPLFFCIKKTKKKFAIDRIYAYSKV